MSGPSIASTDIASACVADATSVLTDTYQDDAVWYQGVFEIVDPATCSHAPFGDKSTNLVFGTKPRRRADGQEYSHSKAITGWVPQGAINLYSDAIAIPERVMEGNQGKANAVKLVAEFTKIFTRNAIDQKNQYVADMLNHGAYTAGDTNVFLNSFEGNSAADGFVYDGKAMFADDHALKVGGSTVIDNYLAGTTLSASNLDVAYVRMGQTNAIDETGARVTINPRLILVPPQLRVTAHQIINSADDPSTANRATNANYGLVQYKLVRNLSATAGWFMVGAPEAIRVIDSGAPMLRRWWDDETASWHFALEYRFGAYCRDVRHLLAANTATS